MLLIRGSSCGWEDLWRGIGRGGHHRDRAPLRVRRARSIRRVRLLCVGVVRVTYEEVVRPPRRGSIALEVGALTLPEDDFRQQTAPDI